LVGTKWSQVQILSARHRKCALNREFAVDQYLPVDTDRRTGLDTPRLDMASDQDASEADLIDQAINVPIPDDLPPWV
jgi:hypothetical protein